MAVSRFPGLAIYYTDTLKGLPQVFEQLLDTAPTLHRIVVFLHIRQVIPGSVTFPTSSSCSAVQSLSSHARRPGKDVTASGWPYCFMCQGCCSACASVQVGIPEEIWLLVKRFSHQGAMCHTVTES